MTAETMHAAAVSASAPIPRSECPECAALVTSQVALPGEILDCGDCGAELEVRSVQPLVLAVAPQVEEDWGE